MDDFNLFWRHYFNVDASLVERRLLELVGIAVPPGDPLFIVTAMLTRQLYISLGETEKALLQFGPVLSERMVHLETEFEKLRSGFAPILRQTKELERRISMLNAHAIDREQDIRSKVATWAAATVSADYGAIVPWIIGISTGVIAGVIAMVLSLS